MFVTTILDIILNIYLQMNPFTYCNVPNGTIVEGFLSLMLATFAVSERITLMCLIVSSHYRYTLLYKLQIAVGDTSYRKPSRVSLSAERRSTRESRHMRA